MVRILKRFRVVRLMSLSFCVLYVIVGSDIAREKDGLTMSSRNVHLSGKKRQRVQLALGNS